MINDTSQIPYRRSIRLKEYDYSQPASYFVTICTHNHECIFGNVIDYEIQLNEFGRIATNCWQKIPSHFTRVNTDAFVVMPNHVHGILVILEYDETPGAGTACRAPTRRRFGRPTSDSLSTIIGAFKSAATKHINAMPNKPTTPIWQRNYHEHIIRNEDDMAEIREYIANNPARWGEDKYNPHIGKAQIIRRFWGRRD